MTQLLGIFLLLHELVMKRLPALFAARQRENFGLNYGDRKVKAGLDLLEDLEEGKRR